MVTDEMLLKMMIRTYAFMRRNPDGAGDDLTLKSKGFGSILDLLALQDGISQTELADMARIRRQSAAEALAQLEKEGYVRREASENDRRALLVYITDSGRYVQKVMKTRREQMAERFFCCLSNEEKENLYAILLKLENGKE